MAADWKVKVILWYLHLPTNSFGQCRLAEPTTQTEDENASHCNVSSDDILTRKSSDQLWPGLDVEVWADSSQDCCITGFSVLQLLQYVQPQSYITACISSMGWGCMMGNRELRKSLQVYWGQLGFSWPVLNGNRSKGLYFTHEMLENAVLNPQEEQRRWAPSAKICS